MKVPDTVTMRCSAECVWSGEEKPGGNLKIAPNAPLFGSPHSVACLTAEGRPGTSVHFRSPAGQISGVFPELLCAVFGLLAAAPCARTVAATMEATRKPRGPLQVLIMMFLSFSFASYPGAHGSQEALAGEKLLRSEWALRKDRNACHSSRRGLGYPCRKHPKLQGGTSVDHGRCGGDRCVLRSNRLRKRTDVWGVGGARRRQQIMTDHKSPYLIPITIESGPTRCSTRVSRQTA